jgi:hypothetical protein
VRFDRLSVKEEKNTADKWSGSFPFNLLFNRRSVFVVVTSKSVRNPQSPKSHSSLFPNLLQDEELEADRLSNEVQAFFGNVPVRLTTPFSIYLFCILHFFLQAQIAAIGNQHQLPPVPVPQQLQPLPMPPQPV